MSARRARLKKPSTLRFGLFQLVANAEPLARRVVHLPRRLLGVLQLRQTVLDLRELLLDLPLELLDLLLRDRQRVLVELLLLVRKGHAGCPPPVCAFGIQGLTSTMTGRHILTGTPFLVAGWNFALRTAESTASLTAGCATPFWRRASATPPFSSTSTSTITLPWTRC